MVPLPPGQALFTERAIRHERTEAWADVVRMVVWDEEHPPRPLEPWWEDDEDDEGS